MGLFSRSSSRVQGGLSPSDITEGCNYGNAAGKGNRQALEVPDSGPDPNEANNHGTGGNVRRKSSMYFTSNVARNSTFARSKSMLRGDVRLRRTSFRKAPETHQEPQTSPQPELHTESSLGGMDILRDSVRRMVLRSPSRIDRTVSGVKSNSTNMNQVFSPVTPSDDVSTPRQLSGQKYDREHCMSNPGARNSAFSRSKSSYRREARMRNRPLRRASDAGKGSRINGIAQPELQKVSSIIDTDVLRDSVRRLFLRSPRRSDHGGRNAGNVGSHPSSPTASADDKNVQRPLGGQKYEDRERGMSSRKARDTDTPKLKQRRQLSRRTKSLSITRSLSRSRREKEVSRKSHLSPRRSIASPKKARSSSRQKHSSPRQAQSSPKKAYGVVGTEAPKKPSEDINKEEAAASHGSSGQTSGEVLDRRESHRPFTAELFAFNESAAASSQNNRPRRRFPSLDRLSSLITSPRANSSPRVLISSASLSSDASNPSPRSFPLLQRLKSLNLSRHLSKSSTKSGTEEETVHAGKSLDSTSSRHANDTNDTEEVLLQNISLQEQEATQRTPFYWGPLKSEHQNIASGRKNSRERRQSPRWDFVVSRSSARSPQRLLQLDHSANDLQKTNTGSDLLYTPSDEFFEAEVTKIDDPEEVLSLDEEVAKVKTEQENTTPTCHEAKKTTPLPAKELEQRAEDSDESFLDHEDVDVLLFDTDSESGISPMHELDDYAEAQIASWTNRDAPKKRPPSLLFAEPSTSLSSLEESPFGSTGDFNGGGFRITAEGMVDMQRRVTKKDSENYSSDGACPPSSRMVIVRSLDEFRKGRTLGAGVAGRVYLAKHVPTARLMAIKVVNVYDEAKRNQLLKELETLTTHVSRYLVRFYGAFYNGSGAVHIALEYMDRGCLASVVQKYGPIEEAIVKMIASDCLRGLRFLHRSRVIHRDFKTANILLSRRQCCTKLSDFGLARDVNPEVSKVDTFVGTVAYMSPERLQGSKYTYASDIWALGVSIAECLLGRYPFEKPSSYFDYIEASMTANMLSVRGAQFSKEAQDFVTQCTNVDPKRRPSAMHLMKHPWIASSRRDPQLFASWLDSLGPPEPRR